MKSKLLCYLCIPVLLLSGCSQNKNPIVGNKFNFVNEKPIVTYEEGYDESSYLALLSSVSSFVDFTSVDDITNRFTDSICKNGFLKVSGTTLMGSYLCYNNDSEEVVCCFLSLENEKDDKAKFVYVDSSTGKNRPFYISSASFGFDDSSVKFEIIADTFEKDEDKYYATVISKYYEDASSEISIDASFVYTFEKA